MRITIILLAVLAIGSSTSAFAQAAAAAPQEVPKMKVAIIDYAALREQVAELKVKYELLQKEFLPVAQEIETLQGTLAAQEKTLAENKGLTPQQSAKRAADLDNGKKEYQRKVEDAQALAGRREREVAIPVLEKVQTFLAQYCQKFGITTVFDARRLQETGIVVYAAPNANITDDFVKAYNAANPLPAK